jgi:hypothetical protein
MVRRVFSSGWPPPTDTPAAAITTGSPSKFNCLTSSATGHGHLVKKKMIHNQWITNYIQRCREIT